MQNTNSKELFIASRTGIASTYVEGCFKKAEYTNPLIKGRLLILNKEKFSKGAGSKANNDQVPENNQVNQENAKLTREKENFAERFQYFLDKTAYLKEDFREYHCKIDIVLSENHGYIKVITGFLDFTIEVNEKGWYIFTKDYEDKEFDKFPKDDAETDMLPAQETSIAVITKLSA